MINVHNNVLSYQFLILEKNIIFSSANLKLYQLI